MKVLFFLLLSVFIMQECSGQLLKKLGDKIKRDAAWRVRVKTDHVIGNAIDSALEAPEKIIKHKAKTDDAENDNTTVSKKNPKDAKKETIDEKGTGTEDGFITLSLSASSVFTGGNISINGESIKYKNFNEVEVTVSGPSAKDVKSVLLDANGKFTTVWYAPDRAGDYTVTVKGSDKKSLRSEKINVYGIPMLSNWCTENIELTKKAFDKLKDAEEKINDLIGTKDKAALEEKVAALKDKTDLVLKLFNDINTAGKETSALAKSGKKLSPNLVDNLSELNNKLADERKKMKQIEEFNDHAPADNTICEYLVLLNEACAAFSVYTNIECFAVKGIIKNITLDKAVPKYVSVVNERNKGLSEPNDFALKEPAKIFATSLLDAESLTTKLGTAGFAGDIVQFATDFLIKKYCGVYKGDFKHDYSIQFRNSKGENWWTYGVNMKAVLSLRYPKDRGKGNIIKMKGNIEGNATKFTFFQDVEKEDGFKEGSKGKIDVVPIKTFTPLALSVATSERDILGFGAIARGMATPAYFNIPIDAEYNVTEEKIKIFVNAAIVDFTIYVTNKFVFLLVGADLIPYIKQMNFPIHNAQLTISSVLSSHNEFEIVRDSKGNQSFSGKVNKHIGDKSTVRETDLNFTISVKKEN